MKKWDSILEIDGSFWIMEDKKIIAVVKKRYGNRANANLIASAPELLEACKEAVKEITRQDGGGDYVSAVSWLNNAIKKAEVK